VNRFIYLVQYRYPGQAWQTCEGRYFYLADARRMLAGLRDQDPFLARPDRSRVKPVLDLAGGAQ
jgi:hypothetical protein